MSSAPEAVQKCFAAHNGAYDILRLAGRSRTLPDVQDAPIGLAVPGDFEGGCALNYAILTDTDIVKHKEALGAAVFKWRELHNQLRRREENDAIAAAFKEIADQLEKVLDSSGPPVLTALLDNEQREVERLRGELNKATELLEQACAVQPLEDPGAAIRVQAALAGLRATVEARVWNQPEP